MDEESLLEKFKMVRMQTEKLCAPLFTEDYVVQPIVDVSPPKWHLAHSTWFFETFILQKYCPGYLLFNNDFGYFFNSYYETMGKRVLRNERGFMTRPVTKEVYEYREYVTGKMVEYLASGGAPAEVWNLLELGMNHEQQHQELLVTDLKYILSLNPLCPEYLPAKPESETGNPSGLVENYLEVGEGIHEIGHSGTGFCFDNELGRHKVFNHAFKVLDRLVTNGEYLEFMNDGGYGNFRLWLADGWDWVNVNNISAPLYWVRKEDEWHHFTLHGLSRVRPGAPVTHISHYEADAFARWKGKRLPTEFEWETAFNRFGEKMPQAANFLESGNFAPMARQKDSLQLLGDVWEWTGSNYLPYPYYSQAEGALGEYNGKFMSNQMVLRGGSCATPLSHIRATYRNFFQPDKRWQFTGIRLADYL